MLLYLRAPGCSFEQLKARSLESLWFWPAEVSLLTGAPEEFWALLAASLLLTFPKYMGDGP